MSKLIQYGCAVLLFCCPMLAAPDAPDTGKNKPPRVTLNANDTPLDRLIEKAKNDIKKKVDEEKLKGNQACVDAEGLPDDDEKPGKKSKACKVMQFKGPEKVKDPVELKKDAHGNIVGKKVKTKTKLVVDNAGQLTGQPLSRWDDLNQLKHAGRPNLPFVGTPAGLQAAQLRIRTAQLPASEAINNDKDCIDRATGQRLGGWVRDAGGNQVSNPDSCFDSSGLLIKTLTSLDDPTQGCSHANGKLYSAAECEELKFTTLEELIDEDGPDGAQLDDDQDGFSDEDGPELDTGNSICDQHGGERIVGASGESCDFTHEIRRRANEQAAKDQPHGKKKVFKINDNGDCDSNAEGEYACGEEPREIEIEETMELSCPPGGIFEEDRCLIPPAGPKGTLARAYLVNSAGSDTVVDYAMMGFTFAPPVLKWGINEVDRVCIFGWCFEIFALRFGYEFELAAGLRLPAKVTVTDIPSRAVVEQELNLGAGLEAANFTVDDYVSFCRKHDLDRSWWISDCNRFAFPEYFESLMPDWMFTSPGARQGQEFVAQTTVFAGLQIRLFSIPVVNFAVDSSVNVPAMCTLYKLKKQLLESDPAELLQLLAAFGTDFQKSKNFMSSMEQTLTNCASFTTPYGMDENGDPRQFPFLTGSFSVPADCTREIIENAAVKVGGQSKPMCTGLKVNIYGATLGLGLELVPQAYSDLIKTKATTIGDAWPLDQELRFHWGDANPTIGPVRFDNYNRGADSDTATIQLNEFVYYLNNFEVKVNGLIELGGLLAFIGNVASVPLVTLRFDADDYGIPIPQHPGTGPISIEVPVSNYALTVDLKPRPDDPKRVSDDVLRVMPGTSGIFEVWVKNEGTVPDTMDQFAAALSNRPQSLAPYVFGIYPNTDFDCVDSTNKAYWGYPFDNIADDCYDDNGNMLPGRTEVTADDSTAVWQATLSATSVPNVAAHSIASTPVWLTVTPYRHPLTKPGDYPVRITADSRTARELKLEAIDPANLPRLGAEDVALMRIEAFFEPQMTVTPAEASVKPGQATTYTAEVTNYGNDADRFTMNVAFADSDTAGCSLTSNGTITACPYRAHVTRIDAPAWTTVADFDALFPMTGFFQPLANGKDSFNIRAPLDWAGMQDTMYEFTVTATSTADPAIPRAKNAKTVRFKVVATKESMSRYLNLEVTEFLEQITQADAQGLATRGIKPVLLHPVSMMATKALEQILAGDLAGASKSLSSAIKVMEAVDRMVNGAGLPEPLGTDWKARSAAILADLTLAQASSTTSQ